MSKKNSKSKWLAFATLVMFVAAVFQIADDNVLFGIICFSVAVSFAALANVQREKEKEEKEEEVEDK